MINKKSFNTSKLENVTEIYFRHYLFILSNNFIGDKYKFPKLILENGKEIKKSQRKAVEMVNAWFQSE